MCTQTMAVAVALAALLASCTASLGAEVSTRTVVTFDFGWRHRLGLHERPAPGGPPDPPSTGPGENPAEATLDYDDSAWPHIHLPHDALITQGASKVSCPPPGGCSGRSFIPRHVMWYRKSFALPAGWGSAGSERTDHLWVEFDGVFHSAIVYLNGVVVARNAEGYLGFRVPLGNTTGTLRGDGERNVLAVFVDPDGGAGFSSIGRSGWWYEGGGLYRHARLVRTASLHIAQDGLVARSVISWGASRGEPSADAATLSATATLANAGAVATAAGAEVLFTLVDSTTGRVVGSAVSAALPPISPGGHVEASASIVVASPRLWSVRSPTLYTVAAQVRTGGDPQSAVDEVNVTHGFRTLVFSGADGAPSCTLNGRPFKWRGFCDHDNFAVVGMAVPDRIKLFRAQMSRAVGGNARRTSHNPPDPLMLSIYDALGTVVMDETRQFNAANTSVDAMAALVRRDRNHPSVAMWSFCNEGSCEKPTWNSFPKGAGDPQLGAPLFAAVVKAEDGTRPTSANTPGWNGPYPPFIPSDMLTNSIDIQGFSHAGMRQGDSFGPLNGSIHQVANSPALFHNMSQYKAKPIFGSECCCCNTMRDEDVGCESSNGVDVCVQKSFSADCAQEQTAVYDNAPFVVGTMVWTLFDYYGEPSGNWPNVISSFGQFDLAGFPKAQAYWYQAQWLLRSADSRADKTFETGGGSSVHLVESWEKPRPVPPVLWPVPRQCNISAFQHLCASPWDNATVRSGCIDCLRKHAAEMGAWGCGFNMSQGDEHGTCCTWVALCRTGGVPPPKPPLAPPSTRNVTVYSAAASVELIVNGRSLGTKGVGPLHTWAEWDNVHWAAGNATAVGRSNTGQIVAVDTRLTCGIATGIVLSLDVPSEATGTGGALLADGQDTALVRASIVDSRGNVVHDAAHDVTFVVKSGSGRLAGTHNGRIDSHGRADADTVAAYHGLARAVVVVTSVAALPAVQRALLAAIDIDSVVDGLVDGAALSQIVVEASSPGLPPAQLAIPVSTAAADGVLEVARRSAGKVVLFR